MKAFFPALESLSGVFNNIIITFPLSAVAVLLFLVNWRGHHGIFSAALRKRCGVWSAAVHLLVVLCAIAALAKPFIYVVPHLLKARGAGIDAQLLWFQWSPVVVWLSFLFEYLFGVAVQMYLILMAYLWVRGLSFTHHDLLEFAIRRFSYVMKWAAVVMLLSTLCIDAPLILKNFPLFAP